jgi:hypothetical protein
MKRNRLLYLLGCGILIVLGLSSRRFAHALPDFIALYAGDTMWALMLFMGLGFLFARWPTSRVFIVALLICYAVETSQLYHAQWIDAIRNTRLGGLMLGYGFLWSDIACYTVGVSLGALLEIFVVKRSNGFN